MKARKSQFCPIYFKKSWLVLYFCKWLTTQFVDSFVKQFFQRPIPVCLCVLAVWTWTQRNPVCSTSPLHLAALSATTSHPAKKAAPASCLFVHVFFVCASMSASDPPHLSLTSTILCPARDEQLHLACRSPYVYGWWTVAHLCEQFLFGDQCVLFWEREKKKMNSLSVLLCSRILSLLTTTTLVHLGVSVPPGSCPAEVSSSRHRPPPALNDSGTLGFTPSAGGRVGDGRRWTSTTCQMLGPGREGRSREVPAVVPTGLWL